MGYKGTFKCIIMSPKTLIYENEIHSLFLTGDQGEYELLAYHYPLIGLVSKGEIVVDNERKIPVNSGVVRFFANECTILVEEGKKAKVAH